MATKSIPEPLKQPGRAVGIVAAIERDDTHTDIIYWVVDDHRKDFNDVVDAAETRKKVGNQLPSYSQMLVDAAFKNWG